METKTQIDIEREIKALIAERFEFGLEKVTDETSLITLGLDSLDTYELILTLEEEYGIEIKAYDKIKNVGQLITSIEGEYVKIRGGEK
ncbi:acyl carrier protein [Candidatus Pacearchaeota archaeon]|nr:acyl carrier protein [Candidatus Pacearchaeota archaeon]